MTTKPNELADEIERDVYAALAKYVEEQGGDPGTAHIIHTASRIAMEKAALRSSVPSEAKALDAALANMRSGLVALRMIREAVELLGPVGAMPSEEFVSCVIAPTPEAEAEAIIAGIQKIAALRLSPTVVDDSAEAPSPFGPGACAGMEWPDDDAPAGETAPDPVAADGIVGRLRAIDETAMYDAPATSEAAIREAADLIERHPTDLARARAEGRREMAEGAAKAFDMLHDSLLSNGPKQASGEQAAYWRDRFRSLAEKNNG